LPYKFSLIYILIIRQFVKFLTARSNTGNYTKNMLTPTKVYPSDETAGRSAVQTPPKKNALVLGIILPIILLFIVGVMLVIFAQTRNINPPGEQTNPSLNSLQTR